MQSNDGPKRPSLLCQGPPLRSKPTMCISRNGIWRMKNLRFHSRATWANMMLPAWSRDLHWTLPLTLEPEATVPTAACWRPSRMQSTNPEKNWANHAAPPHVMALWAGDIVDACRQLRRSCVPLWKEPDSHCACVQSPRGRCTWCLTTVPWHRCRSTLQQHRST